MASFDSASEQQAPKSRPQSRFRAIMGGTAGNLVEWYDWFAYSAFALYFAPHFFPKGDETAQLLQAAAVFAVGFVARPVGAWLMGLYADRRGRRSALSLSVAMMCAGSMAIALLPDHAQIGMLAPLGLVAARLVQGLSLGGEYGASATYMSEMAGRARRGFWSSFQYVSVILGQLTALGVLILLQNVMEPQDLEGWGWRIPFAIGGVLAVVVFWMRRGLEESVSFDAGASARDERRASTRLLLREHPFEAAMIFGLTAGGSLAFYAYTTYMQKFLVNTTGFSKDVATLLTAAALGAYMCLQPVYGFISDRIGRKPLLVGGFALGAVFTYPLMNAIATAQSPSAALILMMGLLAILSGYTSINAVVKAELFPAHIRALGVALPYAAANVMFGGTAEYVALWFKSQGQESGFYIYVSAMMAISCVIAIALRDTRLNSLILED